MYYTIGTTPDGRNVRVPIEPDNVYTTCPGCGKDHAVDLEWLVQQDPEFSFADTKVYCGACSRKRNPSGPEIRIVQ